MYTIIVLVVFLSIVNLAYLECKEAKGKHPKECIALAKPVVTCYDSV